MKGLSDGGAVVVRRAERASDAELADLFNRAHAHLAGTIRRSAQDIGWRCRSQPGMSEDGALVAEVDDEVVGYAFVKDNGDIIEFAVDPAISSRAVVAGALIRACEARVIEAGAKRMRLNVPTGDDDLESAFAEAGLAASNSDGKHYIAAMDPGRLLDALASAATGTARIELVISDPHPWQSPRSFVALGAGDDEGPAFSIETGQQTLNDILLGGHSPLLALASRRLQVRPVVMTSTAIRWLKQVQVAEPWFYTLGDVL